MKPAHLLLQALLVVAGLFAYDQLRGDEPPIGRADVAPNGAPASPARDEGARAQAEALTRRVAALETRLELLTRAGAAQPASAAAPESPRAPVRIPEARDVEVPAAVPVVDERFTAEEIARFRALEAAAKRQERAEALRRRIERVLDRSGVALADEDRRLVVDESLRTWLRAETVRAQRPAQPRQAADRLRADYADAIGRIVRGSHADVLLRQLVPLLGLEPAALSGRQPEDR